MAVSNLSAARQANANASNAELPPLEDAGDARLMLKVAASTAATDEQMLRLKPSAPSLVEVAGGIAKVLRA